MVISQTGLLMGATASIAMITSIIFGIYFIYKSRKLNADLLLYSGLLIICTGCFYLGTFTDFILVLFFGTNIPLEIRGLHGLLAFTPVAPAVLCAMYLGSSLIAPSKKKIITGVYVVIGIIFEVILYLTYNTAIDYPIAGDGVAGSDLIDSSFNTSELTFYLIIFFLISALIFCGIGFTVKAKQSIGDLRRKFVYLSLGFIIFVLCAALDALMDPGFSLIFIRLGMIGYAWLVYLGLKPS